MKNKIRIPLMFLITIMLAGLVHAVSTFDTLASSATLGTETYNFNVSCGIANATNASVTATSALTSESITFWVYNYSVSDNFCNDTLTIANWTDASDYGFAGTCYNETNSQSVTALTTVVLDHAVPICTLASSQASNSEYLPTSTWTVTCTNATSAIIKFGSNTYTMTETSDVCSYSAGIHEATTSVTITTSDGLNTTDCTELTDVAIKRSKTAATDSTVKKTTKKEADKTVIFGLVAAVLFIGYLRTRKK